MDLTSLTAEEILQEIRDLAQYQGIATRAAWDELVSEVVDAHLDLAEFNQDEDLENLKETLKAGWSEYEEDVVESDQLIEEDAPEQPEDREVALHELEEDESEEEEIF
jgi:hypothetical protein